MEMVFILNIVDCIGIGDVFVVGIFYVDVE